MAIKMSLPIAQSDVQHVRAFYKRQNSLNQYRHCHDVYKKAVRFGIIDEGIIRCQEADAPLRQSHLLRRRLALLHVVDSSQLGRVAGMLPAHMVDDALMEELHVYGELTLLERRGAPKPDFLALLNNGKRPLAPLIKIPDCSLTHDTEDELAGFISTGHPSIIRQYSSVRDAREAMRLDLKAAEKIWAPLAGFYGYQELKGDIFEQSYRVNHPEVYASVVANLADELTQERLRTTQPIVREAARIIAGMLRSYGFTAEVPLRELKHRGNQMEKARRILKEDYGHLPEEGRPHLEEFVRRNAGAFNFDRFNDLVAVRAIVDSFRGFSIDRILRDSVHAVEPEMVGVPVDLGRIKTLLESIRVPSLRLAVKAVADSLLSLRLIYPDLLGESECLVEYKRKDNGYRSFHFDMRATGPYGRKTVPFEFQLRTSEWHYISERGGAAHYLLKGGGDPELIDILGNGYHDLLYSSEGNGPGSRNGGPDGGQPGR
jgi:hypothetical protein